MCGDYNTAHTEIALAHPRQTTKVSGVPPEGERGIDTYVSHGYHDTFRMFHKEGGHYSWWDLVKNEGP